MGHNRGESHGSLEGAEQPQLAKREDCLFSQVWYLQANYWGSSGIGIAGNRDRKIKMKDRKKKFDRSQKTHVKINGDCKS